MKISIGTKIKNSAWGGGNNFAINLANYLEKNRYDKLKSCNEIKELLNEKKIKYIYTNENYYLKCAFFKGLNAKTFHNSKQLILNVN